jgi:AcrR family transcriptional regulator
MDQNVDAVRSTPEMWIEAAYDSLLEGGIETVRILPLAKKLNLSRTSFYWFFKDRDELLSTLLERWKSKNTGNWIERTQAYAETICEAMLNVSDCYFDNDVFDSRYEAAMRNWAQQSAEVAKVLSKDDERRVTALIAMFERFGYDAAASEIRARTMYYTQLGYIAANPPESMPLRMSRMCAYVEFFTGVKPEPRELERFFSRRKVWPADKKAVKRGKGR